MRKVYGGVIFCYSRTGRTNAAAALKASGIRLAEYLSRTAMEGDTARYVFTGAPKYRIEKLTKTLEANGEGTELYTDRS